MDFKFINTAYLEMVSAGDNATIVELIEIFREQANELYNEMRVCLSEKNYTGLGMLAHKAKSSVAIIGMEELAAMLKEIETDSREGRNVENYGPFIERFKADTISAISELDSWTSDRLREEKGKDQY